MPQPASHTKKVYRFCYHTIRAWHAGMLSDGDVAHMCQVLNVRNELHVWQAAQRSFDLRHKGIRAT